MGLVVYTYYPINYRNDASLCNKALGWTPELCVASNPVKYYGYQGIMMMSTYGFGFLFWLLSIFNEDNGNLIFRIWYYLSKAFVLAPLVNIAFAY